MFHDIFFGKTGFCTFYKTFFFFCKWFYWPRKKVFLYSLFCTYSLLFVFNVFVDVVTWFKQQLNFNLREECLWLSFMLNKKSRGIFWTWTKIRKIEVFFYWYFLVFLIEILWCFINIFSFLLNKIYSLKWCIQLFLWMTNSF